MIVVKLKENVKRDKQKLVKHLKKKQSKNETSASARRISRHTPSLSPGVLSTGR